MVLEQDVEAPMALDARGLDQASEIERLRRAADKQSRVDVAEARRALREQNAVDEFERTSVATPVAPNATQSPYSGVGFDVEPEVVATDVVVLRPSAVELIAYLERSVFGEPEPKLDADARVNQFVQPVVDEQVSVEDQAISVSAEVWATFESDPDSTVDGVTPAGMTLTPDVAEPLTFDSVPVQSDEPNMEHPAPWSFDFGISEPEAASELDARFVEMDAVQESVAIDFVSVDVAAIESGVDFALDGELADSYEVEAHQPGHESEVVAPEFVDYDFADVKPAAAEALDDPISTPEFVEFDFEDVAVHDDTIIVERPADGYAQPTDETAVVEPVEEEIVQEDVVAEIVLDEIALVELPAPPAAAELAPEVHIHHHYAADAAPAPQQIQYVQAPVERTQPPSDQPQSYAAPAPQQPIARAKRNRSESRVEYIGAPEPVITEQSEVFVPMNETLKMPKKPKEPLFMWRGKPIGGDKRSPAEIAEARRIALSPRPAPVPQQSQPATSPTRVSVSNQPYVSSGVDTQTWFAQSVQTCLELGVSDIHISFETDGRGAERLSARIRVDGQLRPFQTIDGLDARTIITKFKTLTNLSTVGNFIPEEGVYDVPVGDDVRKARVALFRTATGGDALVLRLPPTGKLRRLEELEFSDHNLSFFKDLLQGANRMTLIAGPMGSGKTTTVHGALAEIATPERSVWSIEDPVERTIPGLNQLEVDEANGAGFAALLPVLVRSDYDTLFLGEIRDQATAAAGVRQAKAGRQVLTTIHATDNIMALKRLIELSGDSPMSALDSVLGVVSQRLLRKLNPEWDRVNPTTKYRGRVPIHEALRVNDHLIEAIVRETTIFELKQVAAEASHSTFAEDAKRLVAAGITDWDEVHRVLRA
jgi:type II secretory ATPase GspE/PulE/Tfp pilus assembly ATPase PilB-like protein